MRKLCWTVRLTDSRIEQGEGGYGMKRRVRVLAVVPLAMFTLGLVALQAGPAMAKKGGQGNAVLHISCASSGHVTITNEGPGNAWLVQPIPPHDSDKSGKLKVGQSITFSVSGSGPFTAHGHHGNSENSGALTGNTVNCAAGGPTGGTTGGGTQASTGFSALPYAAAAVLLLGMGGSFLLVSRRRTV